MEVFMKILDKEFDFNFEEAENIDKVMVLDKEYQEKLKTTGTLVEKCKVYKDFFDELIGKGTSEKLFGNKNNFFEITDAYSELVEEAEKVSKKLQEKTKKMRTKYERYK